MATRERILTLLSGAVLLLALLATPAGAEDVQNATTERGFSPEKAFQIGDLDHVSLFNGNLVVTIPVGLRYPLDGGLTYGLTLSYNVSSWKYDDFCPSNDIRCYNRALVVADDNAGLGWQLGLGELRPPLSVKNTTSRWVYASPDGADHPFHGTLHNGDGFDGASYTRDGSYLRMKELAGGIREIEFPDATVHKFSSTGNLLQIRSRDGAAYVDVTHVYTGNTLVRWDLADSVGRTHKVTFVQKTVDGKTVPYVSTVELSRFGTTAKSIYRFSYTAGTIRRPPQHDDPTLGSTANVEFLTRLELPDGSAYTMPVGNPNLQGQLEKLTLPTLGSLQWTWRNYFFPALQQPWKPPAPEPPPDPYSQTSGVGTRTLLDASGVVEGQWSYSQSLGTNSSTTTVTDPLGHRFEHRFYADPESVAHGLPYDPNTLDPLGGGRYLSAKVFPAGSATPLRSTYVRYEWDEPEAFPDPWGLIPITEINRRQASERTVYHDYGDGWASSSSSGFDGLGHYRTVTTGGNFGSGDVRTTTTNFNPARGTYLHEGAGVGHTFTMLPVSSPWVLETYDEQSESEGGVTAKRQLCFDASSGRLLRERVMSSTSPGSQDVVRLLTYDAQGNRIRQQDFGGDTQAVGTGSLCSVSLPSSSSAYWQEHTYQYGVLATSQYREASGAYLPFKHVDQTIDLYTGLISSSRDASGLQTNYEYDLLGRLTWEKPLAGNRDGWTQYVYTRATTASALAKVHVYRRPNNSTTGLRAQSEILFDAFGRVWKERTKMPGGVWATRETRYTAHGWPSSVSELDSVSSPAKKTLYNLYDPFGRPAEMVPPDGSGHKVTFWYSGPQNRTRLVKVGTSRNATTGAIVESTVQTAETYDRQGRLWKVTEDSGAGNSNWLTEYTYDVGNRLTRVTQVRSEGTQYRYFNYDKRGFLLSERHPEKGISGNGYVYYYTYDPRGHARRRVDGPSDLSFTLDRAERLTQVKETYGLARVLETRSYGTANSGSNYRLGKLVSATRHNYHERWGVDFDVVESYTYAGREGRVSQKVSTLNSGLDTYTQTFTWNDLGDLASQTYPVCGQCPPGTAASRTVSYTYTEGRLTAIAGYATSITYHPNGLVDQITHANGVVSTQANDPNRLRRPASITVKQGTTTLFATGTYGYDGAGNVVTMGSDWYLYDRYGRLIEGTALQAGSSRKQTFAYDGFSNLTSITTWVSGFPSTRTNATVATTNRLSAASYDSAGNQLSWGGYTYTWDPFQMGKSYQGGGNDWAFIYTAEGERILSFDASTGTSTFRLRDLDGKCVREFRYAGGVWSWQRDWIHREGQPLVSISPPEGTRYLHPDHLGTPRVITTSLGTVAATNHYYPFGEHAGGTGSSLEPLRFTGHERDPGTSAGTTDDLDYMHARYYHPQLGRFLATDPASAATLQSGDLDDRLKLQEFLSQPRSWNRYSYALSSPVLYKDPNGETAEIAIGSMLEFAGGSTGAAAGSAAAGPLIVAAGVGVGLGILVNQIPGVSEALTFDAFSESIANTFFSTRAGEARNFINTKVSTVLAHINRYEAPDPNDPDDKSNKKNIGDRMKKHLEAARDRLKRMRGKTRQQYEELIKRTEEQLEKWIRGVNAS